MADDRKINISDQIGSISAASDFQIAAMRAALKIPETIAEALEGLGGGGSGTDGLGILNGEGTPPASLGRNGEFYVDTLAGRFWGPKRDGAWTTNFSLVGGLTGENIAGLLDDLFGTTSWRPTFGGLGFPWRFPKRFKA